MMKRGQVSIEYLFIMGFTLLLLSPLLLFFNTQSDDIRVRMVETQARLAATSIAESASRVYYSASPTYETITVRIPDGVQSFNIYNQSVVFGMKGYSYYDLVVPVNAILIPVSFSNSKGIRSFRIESTDSGVLITEV